jgi:hypothetical protein
MSRSDVPVMYQVYRYSALHYDFLTLSHTIKLVVIYVLCLQRPEQKRRVLLLLKNTHQWDVKYPTVIFVLQADVVMPFRYQILYILVGHRERETSSLFLSFYFVVKTIILSFLLLKLFFFSKCNFSSFALFLFGRMFFFFRDFPRR